MTIAKGTLPLALFGAQGYGQRQGWLMVPARVSQAMAPWLFGLLVVRWTVIAALGFFAVLLLERLALVL